MERTKRAKGEPANGPVSLRLPRDLLRRARRYAERRHLQLASALRTIVSDHLDELEEDEHLTRAERWQRDQAWATARSIIDGTAQEVSWEELRRELLERAQQRRTRRSRR